MIDEIKVVAADIDMTLTAKGGDLPEATKKAFTILHKNNVLIGLATGREIVDNLKTQGKAWGLPFEFDFVIGMNGGMVYDAHNDTMWAEELMKVDEMKAILQWMMPLIEKYKISVNAEGGGNHNAMYILGDLLEAERRHGWYFEDKTGDIDGFCEKRAYKFLFRTEAKYEQMVRERFLEKFSDEWQIVGTFPGTVEVFKKGIDKGHGMLKYCNDQNLDMKNVISFGDNENDDTLLEMSGWGVCLKDGSDGTKACADDVTDYDCADGGVGHYLIDHYIVPKGLN